MVSHQNKVTDFMLVGAKNIRINIMYQFSVLGNTYYILFSQTVWNNPELLILQPADLLFKYRLFTLILIGLI